MAPTLFKMYIGEALKTWKNKCQIMGVRVALHILYTVLFADDQAIVARDKDHASYMLRKFRVFEIQGVENMSANRSY